MIVLHKLVDLSLRLQHFTQKLLINVYLFVLPLKHTLSYHILKICFHKFKL